VILLSVIGSPALLYWLISRAVDLSPDGRDILAIIVGLGGMGFALWRWNRGNRKPAELRESDPR
jgi:hypothetical protein